MTIVEDNSGHDGKRCLAVIWQQADDESVGEPALLVRTYFGSSEPIIAIQQDGQEILINAETIGPLYRVIREMVKKHKELNPK